MAVLPPLLSFVVQEDMATVATPEQVVVADSVVHKAMNKAEDLCLFSKGRGSEAALLLLGGDKGAAVLIWLWWMKPQGLSRQDHDRQRCDQQDGQHLVQVSV